MPAAFMIQGLLEIAAGPAWRQYEHDVARVVEIDNDRTRVTLELDDGREWTIRHIPEGEPTEGRRKLQQLAATRYELLTGAEQPAVFSEQLTTRAMRRALTDHVGVGLSWSDRWRLANATARALVVMLDLVTADQRFELRPRFEAVAYPLYPDPIHGRGDEVQATGAGRLLLRGEVVAEGGSERFRIVRPLSLEVALLASYILWDKGTRSPA